MIRIGDFSRLARITVRALRHYEDAGVLPPAHVDASTGYRYYRYEQLERLHRVLALRDLGLPLDEIRELLADGTDPAQLRARLARQRRRVADDLAAQARRLQRLEALESALAADESAPESAVHVRALAPVAAYTIRSVVPSLGEPVTALFEQAEREVARGALRDDASPFLLFHDLEHCDEELDVEVCIPVRPSPAASRRQALAGLREVEGAAAAGCLTYRGDYGQTDRLYPRMLRWLDASGYAVAGPLREVYHRYGAGQLGYRLPAHRLATRSVEFVTELQIPVVPA